MCASALTRCFFRAAAGAALVILTVLPAAAQTARIDVDATRPGEPMRHVWSFYGYDEANYTTTPDGIALMHTVAAINPEPVYLRKHFLLNNGDGRPALKWGSTNVYTEDEQGNPVYSWDIMDAIMDAVVDAGCRPLVEIGFMPEALTSPTGHIATATPTGSTAGRTIRRRTMRNGAR